jgi:hypothetical protein
MVVRGSGGILRHNITVTACAGRLEFGLGAVTESVPALDGIAAWPALKAP